MLLLELPDVDHKAQAVAKIGYARCSSEEQARDSNALDYQASRLEEHCGTGNVIKDFRSATKCPLRKRTAFLEAIDRLLSLPSGTRRVLLVTRLDRLSRSVDDIRYMRDLMAKGIEFDSLDSGGVEGGAMGNFSLTMRLAMAEYEANLISEKMSLRYMDRRKAGQPMNVPPFGYMMEKKILETSVELRFVPHPEHAHSARLIFASIIKNDGNLNAVLRDCSFDKMPRTAKGLMFWATNRVLIGHTLYHPGTDKEIEKQNTHEPLIDEQTFNAANELIRKRKKVAAPRNNSIPAHPLTGIIRCPCCGYAVSFSTRIYTCTGSKIGRYRREAGQKSIKYSAECRRVRQNNCSGDFGDALKKHSIERLLESTVRRLCARSDELATAVRCESDPGITPEEKMLEDQIANLRRMDQVLMATAIKALEEQLEQLQIKRKGLSDARSAKQQQLKQFQLSYESFFALAPEEQNLILRTFVLRSVPATPYSPEVIELVV